MNDVEIRPARTDDTPAILTYLQLVGGETTNLTFGPEGPDMTEATERAFITSIAERDNAIFLVAAAGDAIVGALTFAGGTKARTRHVGEFGVSVARSHWGTGVGRALIEALLAWAAAGGIVRKIDLLVRVDNERAIALYERLGFVSEGRRSRNLCVDGTFHDVLAMGRAIDPDDR